MRDRYGREINYMRISITDRCNLRCRYCMPDGIDLVPMSHILTYEEIERICSAAAELGISRLKITGGEPLVRLGAPALIGDLKKIPGIRQVTLTTNGVLLGRYLPELLAAGLDAVNISLDTLQRDRYLQITGRDELPVVLDSLDQALRSGLRVKINVVLQQGMNDSEWPDLAELARDRDLDVRFIEMMPIGYGRRLAGISNTELLSRLEERHPHMEKDSAQHGNGPAVYYRIPGWKGTVGFISAMHGRFCGSCNRIRLTAQGHLKPCLCYGDTVDLLPLLRGGSTAVEEQVRQNDRTAGSRLSDGRGQSIRNEGKEKTGDHDNMLLREAIRRAVTEKPEQHCFESEDRITESLKMVSIGG